jgi:hypothetical protein
MTHSKPHQKTTRNRPAPIGIGNRKPRPKGRGKAPNRPQIAGVYLAICVGLLGFDAVASLYLVVEPLIYSGVEGVAPKCELAVSNRSTQLNP